MQNSNENNQTRDQVLWQQYNLIAQNYDLETSESIGNVIVFYYLRDGTTFPIEVNFENYPDRISVELTPQLKQFLMVRDENIISLEDWNPSRSVLAVLDEIQQLVFRYDLSFEAIKILQRSLTLPSQVDNHLSIKFSLFWRGNEQIILIKMSNYPKKVQIEIDSNLTELLGLDSSKIGLSIDGDLNQVIEFIQTLEDRTRRLNHRLKDLEELIASPIVKKCNQETVNQISISVLGKERLKDEMIILLITFPDEYPDIPPVIQLKESFVDVSNYRRFKEEINHIELNWNSNKYLEPTIRGLLEKIQQQQKFVCLVCRDPIPDVTLAAQCSNCERPYHFLCPNCGKRCFEETQHNFGKCVACLEQLVLKN